MNLFDIFESTETYVLYFDGKPVATYDSVYDAEFQARLVKKNIPNLNFEIKKEVCSYQPVQLKENLRDWFKDKWVRFGPDGKIRGDCARGDDSEGKPKCLPQAKAHSLGKKGRASAAARKRREDPDPERRGPAKNVATKKKTTEGVAETFGPLPKDNQQIRLGRHTVDLERVGLNKNYIGFTWNDSKGKEHYEEVAVGDLGSYDDLIDRIKDEIRFQERQYTDQGVAEGFTDDLDNIYAMHPQPEKSEQVVFLITGMTEDEFSNLWTDLPDPYQQEFGYDLPLWDADDLSSYPNLAVKRITFDQYVQLVGNYIKSEELGGSTMSRMKKGMTEGSLKEFAPGSGGEDGRWYTDDEIADIIGEDWFEFDLSGEAANISRHGEHAKILLVQEAQAYFEDRGYHGVTVQDVRDDEDFLSWYISGNFTRLGEGVVEGSGGQKFIVTYNNRLSNDSYTVMVSADDEYDAKDKVSHALGMGDRITDVKSARGNEPTDREYKVFVDPRTSQKRSGIYDRQQGVAEAELDEACWKGYHKEGMKTMFGKRYPNCVKNTNEEQTVKEDTNIPFNTCPGCGGDIVHESELQEKQDACYHKVKSRYKVWPSAYASGALVQCRKKGAKNWGNKSEGVAEGKKSDRYHIVDKDGKPANLASYADKASAIKDRDEKYPGAVVQQVGPRGKVKGVAEGSLEEKWTKKYKDSINCGNPKGFSQKAHCAGKNKNENKEYYNVVGTDKATLRNHFNMSRDQFGWFLKEGATPKQKIEVLRAFGSPKLKEYDLAAHTGGTQIKGDDNVISPVGSKAIIKRS